MMGHGKLPKLAKIQTIKRGHGLRQRGKAPARPCRINSRLSAVVLTFSQQQLREKGQALRGIVGAIHGRPPVCGVSAVAVPCSGASSMVNPAVRLLRTHSRLISISAVRPAPY